MIELLFTFEQQTPSGLKTIVNKILPEAGLESCLNCCIMSSSGDQLENRTVGSLQVFG